MTADRGSNVKAQMRICGKKKCLGCFGTKRKAALAWDKAVLLIYGSEAPYLNFPQARKATLAAAKKELGL